MVVPAPALSLAVLDAGKEIPLSRAEGEASAIIGSDVCRLNVEARQGFITHVLCTRHVEGPPSLDPSLLFESSSNNRRQSSAETATGRVSKQGDSLRLRLRLP